MQRSDGDLNEIVLERGDAAFIAAVARRPRSADKRIAVFFKTCAQRIDLFSAPDAESDMRIAGAWKGFRRILRPGLACKLKARTAVKRKKMDSRLSRLKSGIKLNLSYQVRR